MIDPEKIRELYLAEINRILSDPAKMRQIVEEAAAGVDVDGVVREGLASFKPTNEIFGPLPDGFLGRWERMTVEDFKFLHAVGIDFDDYD